MSLLVVGARGFVGRHLVRTAREAGLAVSVLSSRPGGGIDPGRGQLVPGHRWPEHVDCVVYLAQSPRYRELPDAAPHLLRVNECLAVDVALAALRRGARRFLYASTGNVYAPSFEPLKEASPVRRDDWYALSKLHGEESLLLLRDRIEVSVLRLFGVYGPGQEDKLVPNLIRRVLAQAPVTLDPHPEDPEDHSGLRVSLCHVDDVVALLVRAVQGLALPPVLNVAGDRAVSIRELALRIGQSLGVEPRLVDSERPRQGDLVADTTLLRELTQPPATTLEAGLAATLAPFRAGGTA